MATGKRYYWIKLKESFMSSTVIDYLMSQKDGANYVVLYEMLCLKTINTEGKLCEQIGEIIIPYDVAKIQRDCKWFSADTIRVALELYRNLGLIYEDNDGMLVLSEHNSIVGSETDYKEQKRNQRLQSHPKLLCGCKRLNASTIMLPTGKTQYVDEKRYGGNGMLAIDLAGGVCEMCGADTDLCIHHANGYSNDIDDLYVLCFTCHGKAHSQNPIQLHHNRVQLHHNDEDEESGQGGGQVHTDNRDKDIRDKENRDKDIDNKNSDSIYQAEFEELWQKYPNKKGKDMALKSYIKARKSGVSRETIEQGIDNYAMYCRNKDKQYIKHGSTWFNQKSWQDEYTADRADTAFGDNNYDSHTLEMLTRNRGK